MQRHRNWDEEWFHQGIAGDHGWSDVSKMQHVSMSRNLDINGNTREEAILLQQLSELARLEPKDLDWVSKLAQEINKRSSTQVESNSDQPNVNFPKLSLVVTKFRVWSSSSLQCYPRADFVTHSFKGDYILGISHDSVSVAGCNKAEGGRDIAIDSGVEYYDLVDQSGIVTVGASYFVTYHM
ncbi:hypothetical protein BTUL_0211g00070 [Botrytis tulipae]|uniref:Uncharacterized protein n=1 Tax=Botrytis tulipae TaxID=87230 RepID=A0A4Z1ED57_9HELO|nr:hypothetical protein BTUL_0211g00070 [Botrytis tulipae]